VVGRRATTSNLKVRGAISCSLGCPYQGAVSPDEVERVVMLMKGIGVDHCGVADNQLASATPKAGAGRDGARASSTIRSTK